MTGASQPRPLLLGHRGCRWKGIPENTLSAFRHAMACGCDGFELDVRVTVDGKLVCLHDATFGDKQVSAVDYEQLFKHHLSSGLESAPALLEETLHEFSGSAFLDIELKVAGLENAILKMLEQFSTVQCVVSSFLPEVLTRLGELNPALPLGFIFKDVAGLQTVQHLPVSYVMPRHDLLSRGLIETLHQEGKKVLAWTVNRRAEMLRLSDWGVDGLISDDPALLRETLRGRGSFVG